MMKLPASNSLKLFISTLAAVLLILVGGALWYKQSATTVTPATIETPLTQQENQAVTPLFASASLRLTPTSTAGTFTASVEGLVEPINGIALQIEDPLGGAELVGTSFSLDENLEQTGWSSAINNSADSDTGTILTFAILRTQPTEESTETVSTVQLGTVSFSNAESGINEISLVPSESFVTYSSGNAARLELVVE